MVDARTDQSQPEVAGVEFVTTLFQDHSLHIFTRQVTFKDR